MTTAEQEWQPLTRDDAIAEGWTRGDDPAFPLTVTAAYDEWAYADRDLRAYLSLTLRWMGERYTTVWEQIHSRPAAEDSPSAEDVFDREVGGLWPPDHTWMTLGTILREAVTVYEIYLSKAFAEVARRHGIQGEDQDHTPPWRDLLKSYRLLRLDPRPPAVDEVVKLRNILAHQRGELRTEEDRRRYANQDHGFVPDVAHLTEDRVLGYLNTLGEQVLELDPIVWAYTWTHHRVPALEQKA